jgi:acetyl esterase
MPLDSGVATLLELLRSRNYPPLSEGTPEQGRRLFEALTVETRRPETTPPVGSVEDLDDAPVPVRVYRPQGEPRPTAIAYFHGGGFVIGSIETHDIQARVLCRATGATVVSADYRLAPEHPFPAAVEDSIDVTEWALERFPNVAVGGDSAGANLAAVTAQALRDRVSAQLLVYPPTDFSHIGDDDRYPSRAENADGYFLTQDDMRFFRQHYLAEIADRRDPRASPLYGDLTDLPPAVVVTAEFDPLRDEGNAYAQAMRAAGTRVEHRCFEGQIHGFAGFGVAIPSCGEAADETYALLRQFL